MPRSAEVLVQVKWTCQPFYQTCADDHSSDSVLRLCRRCLVVDVPQVLSCTERVICLKIMSYSSAI
ncbi:hypothetical protein Mapa_006177 [Marchantia paleacea]|nr:hypothetical protein Mapa_006177 [Marchantia paleacea]